MKRKENNNLILITTNTGKNKYFTSLTKAGYYLGIASQSVKWAIEHHNELINNKDEKITLELVDGSEIPYKLINN